VPTPFDAIIFCQEPPEFELRDGMVHILQRMGKNTQTERIMRPSTFLKALRAANRLADEFHAGERNVVAIRRPRRSKEPANGTH
jgi:hypothetical protein